MGRSVLQDWVCDLTFMQQSVIMTAVRGPDGIHKNHVSKLIVRWMRRCALYSAFDQAVLLTPYDDNERRGGSFTGPSCYRKNDRFFVYSDSIVHSSWQSAMIAVLDEYMLTTDEVPHHFQLHFLHAAEIIGYKHSDDDIKLWWFNSYVRLCNDMHLNPESHEQMQRRLGDNEKTWRESEEVRAD